MNKKYMLLMLCLALLCSIVLSACGGNNAENGEGDDTQKFTIKVDHNWGPDHPNHLAMEQKFVPLVKEMSNGTLEVQLYGNNQLGGEREIFDGVNSGTIEMAITGTVMSRDIPKWAVAGDWPFLFNDFEHAKKVFNGPVGEEIAADIEDKSNVKVLGWGASGFRMFSSNKPIETMEDFRGLDIRMPNITTFIRMGELLGINVTSLDFTEVFTALEQGMVDGQENPISIVRSNGWYEVQDYILESNHIFFANAYIISGQLWDQLSEEQKDIIQDAVNETTAYQWDLIANSYENDKKFLEEHGMEFITPDEDFVRSMQETMEPLYEEIYEQYPWAEDIVSQIRAAAE